MRLQLTPAWAAPAAIAAILAGCGTQPIVQSTSHIRQDPARAAAAASIPQTVRQAPMPPPPEARAAEIKYSIVVAGQPVRDVLLAIAAETKVNVDVHPGVEGAVTLNAIDQTLKQILSRIAKQVDMRYEIEGSTIHVMPDSPFLRTYRVDYLNMTRDTTESISVATQILSGASTGGGGGAAAGGSGDNNSTLRITNTARNRFWETVEKNLKDLLRETDKLLPEGSSETFVSGRGQTGVATTQASAARRAATAIGGSGATTATGSTTITTPGQTQTQQASEYVEQRLTFREAASIIVNADAGVITVRATSRQQERVAEYLEQISNASKRQVVIEATIVEVELSDQYQSGVDWSAVASNGLGYSIRQTFTTPSLSSAANVFSLTYANPNPAAGGSILSSIKLLSQFGNTRVLSSPVLMVLNNQTALLKVTDNQVYFTLKSDAVTSNTSTVQNFTSTPNVIPVGFMMNLTPQISESDVVILNVRPTITSIIGVVQDPNPNLLSRNALGVANQIKSEFPVTRTREMESVLRVSSGQTAILGGLMEDRFEGSRGGLPVASRIPIFGDLFSFRDDTARKKELVVFLRPSVIRNASVDGDLAEFRRLVPDREFFKDTRSPMPGFEEGLGRIQRGQMPDSQPNPVVPEAATSGAAR